MTMLIVIVFYFTAIVHQSFGTYSVTKLLKERPTWSFELESVESLIKNTASSVKDADQTTIENMLRNKLDGIIAPGMTHILKKVGDPKWIQDPKKLPTFFDVREKWNECANLMGAMQDEGACNTDSPVAVASVMADRYCIYTNGTVKKSLAPEMLAGCAEFCTRSPLIYKSWKFPTLNGIPTGGSEGSGQGCLPYEEPACQHGDASSITGKKHSLKKLKPCSEDLTYDHDCPKKCTNPKYPNPLDGDLVKCKIFYATATNEFCIRNEILTYGPVVTSIILHDDFYQKPNGIYTGKADRKFVAWDKYLKLIGWGEENDVKYWLAVNTWDQWGDKVFKIPRGVNFDYVEFIVSACVYDD